MLVLKLEKADNGYDIVFNGPAEMVHYIMAEYHEVDEKNECIYVSRKVDSSGVGTLFDDFMRLSDEISQADKLWIRVRPNGVSDIFGT